MIYLVRGNDFQMSVALAKKVGDISTPYELTNATRLRLALVGHGMHVFAEDVEVSPLSSNTVTGIIPGRALLLGRYGLEITFRDGGKDKRFFVDNMFEVVEAIVDDSDDTAEGEGGGVEVSITVQPEDIDFSGAMGTAAGFGTPTIEVDANVGTPFAEITAEGPDTAKIFNFIFHNLKGEPGSDASVTSENIESALGYVPVSPADLAAKTDVFWAIYGTTQGAEINAALEGGKSVLCEYEGLIYPLTDIRYTVSPTFIFTVFDNAYCNQLKCQEDVWTNSSTRMATKVESDAKYTKPGTGIPASDLASDVIPDVSNFITKSVDDLVNYYLKSETYTKAEVQSLIGAIQGFSYVAVSSLPTASASTMGKIYLVPSSSPKTKNVKDEYITLEDNGSYSWEQIGSTAVDLTGYVTTTDLNTALADYTTTANLTTLLAAKQDTIADLSDIRSGAAAGATAYQKPSTGIPKTDLASAVQTSLGKADTAIQDISGKEDKANKVISLSSSSNNTEYPSALCVYNLITGLTAPFTYEVAAALPTADAGTMGVFYVITDGTTSKFYITVESSGTYSWEQVGELAASITLATDGEIDALFE